jgi:hypothetical protein
MRPAQRTEPPDQEQEVGVLTSEKLKPLLSHGVLQASEVDFYGCESTGRS